MSRETYQPPTLAQGSNPGASSQQQQTGGFNLTGQSNFIDDSTKPVKYLCGDCDHEVQLKKGDAIRCKECGYRVLYKQRTDRCVLGSRFPLGAPPVASRTCS